MDRDTLLRRLMEADFALHETVLYLDTHPKCKRAYENYKQMQKAREELAEQYRKRFGPLTYYEVRSTDGWNWTDYPWPWQN
ncbi:MAG: spore coat protein CotJB [Clostridia bacterium]|nr:spore coat protein CotJB [Clostridia bacterium]